MSPTLPDTSETLWLKLPLPNTRPIVIGAVYRSQIEKNFLQTFENVLHSVVSSINKGRRGSPCEIICVGDFNYNAMNKNSKEWGDIVKTMSIFQMQQLITKPTRITLTSKTCLDHIWTNNPHMYSQTGVVSCTLSDHCLVYATRKSVKIKSKVTFIEARSYRIFDQCAFANDLANEDWSSVWNVLHLKKHGACSTIYCYPFVINMLL